jgi:hypothetical protein
MKRTIFSFLMWLSFKQGTLRLLSRPEVLLWHLWVWLCWLKHWAGYGRRTATMERLLWSDMLYAFPRSATIERIAGRNSWGRHNEGMSEPPMSLAEAGFGHNITEYHVLFMRPARSRWFFVGWFIVVFTACYTLGTLILMLLGVR